MFDPFERALSKDTVDLIHLLYFLVCGQFLLISRIKGGKNTILLQQFNVSVKATKKFKAGKGS